MKKWIFPCCIIAIFCFLTALFLTPDFTEHCTEGLLICVNETSQMSFFPKCWASIVCVYHNVVCVLGGLFI